MAGVGLNPIKDDRSISSKFGESFVAVENSERCDFYCSKGFYGSLRVNKEIYGGTFVFGQEPSCGLANRKDFPLEDCG